MWLFYTTQSLSTVGPPPPRLSDNSSPLQRRRLPNGGGLPKNGTLPNIRQKIPMQTSLGVGAAPRGSALPSGDRADLPGVDFPRCLAYLAQQLAPKCTPCCIKNTKEDDIWNLPVILY